MKKIFLVIILPIFTLVSCKKKQEKEPQISTKSDTIFLKDNEVIFISPSDKNIASLKKKYGDNFYTIADDANNYFSIAIEYLDSIKVKYQSFDDDKIIGFKAKNKFTSISKNKNPWSAIVYRNGKYNTVDLANFRNEFILFYNKENEIEKQLDLKNWFGLYLNSDSKDLQTYKSITDKIGWYKLSISANEISFENDYRMESEFPIESPGGIYVNYKCDYNIIGDTIKLYQKTTNTKSVPIKISKSNSQPILILYKKSEKYYGLSDDISQSENLINAIRTKNKSPYHFIKFNEIKTTNVMEKQ